MGFLGSILAEGAAGSIQGIFSGIGTLAKDLRQAITGEISADKKAELLNKTLELEVMAQSGQMTVNQEEAKHRSVFVAGWRPAFGWVGAISIAAYFIPQYIMASVLWVHSCWSTMAMQPFPIPEPAGLLELVGLMLGVGTLRTIEKIKGVTK